MPCVPIYTRLILGSIATLAGIIGGLIGNVLSINVVYMLTRRGGKPTKRPWWVWLIFTTCAVVSIVFGSLAAFAPSDGCNAQNPFGNSFFELLGTVVLGLGLIVFWPLFKKKKIYGILWLAIVLIAGAVVWQQREAYIQTRQEKLIVIIAKFDDTNNDFYQLRDEIHDKLKEEFSDDSNVLIEKVNETITTDVGSDSPRARDLGNNFQADLVIWGSYRQTENPNITIHIENLSEEQLSELESSTTYNPTVAISELESFTYQQQLGAQINTLISFLAGFIKYRAEDYQSALTFFNIALKSDENTNILALNRAVPYFYRGNIFINLKQYNQAILDFNQTIQLDPKSVTAHNNRGLAYYALGQYDQAFTDFNQVIQLSPGFVIAYNNRGIIYKRQKQYDQAFADFNRAIELQPKFFVAYTNRGNAYAELNQYDQAISDFTQAIQLDSRLPTIYYNRGHAYDDSGQHNQAILDFNHTIQLDPNYIKAYNSRGISYLKLKQYEQALADFNLAIQLDSQYSKAYSNRGLVYYDFKQYDKALIDFNQAIQLDPQDPISYFNRGNTYGELKQFDQAIADYSQAIQFNPEYINAYYNRAIVYQFIGKITEAQADFAKYKELTGKDAP